MTYKDRMTKLAMNRTWVEKITNPALQKEAAEETSDFIRSQVRERGIYRRIIPMVEATDDMLSAQVDTDLPVVVEEMQPDSPAAVSVPFDKLPANWYVKGRKFRVPFSRIMTANFQADSEVLSTWKMSIMNVISDQAVKDIMAEEDRAFLSAVNNAMGGSAGVTVPFSGAIQWDTIFGSITRTTILEARAIMMRTRQNLAPATVLMNQITANHVLKLNAVETSNDISAALLREGVASLDSLFSIPNWVVTVKRALVDDDCMYFFAAPEFVGRSYYMTDVTMVVESRGPAVSWYHYETVGGAIANIAGCARADFA